jgi:hypothetical protein
MASEAQMRSGGASELEKRILRLRKGGTGMLKIGKAPEEVANPVLTLEIGAVNISTIIWANGFRYDFDWIDLPIFDQRDRGCASTHAQARNHEPAWRIFPGAAVAP